jgi:hypothetical protein
MAIGDILEDLLSKSLEHEPDRGGTQLNPETTRASGNDVSPDTLLQRLETQCNARYNSSATGLHFVGILLTVFAAELVSAYWESNPQNKERVGPHDRGPARMLSCLYSPETVAFVLSHPPDVSFLPIHN